MTIDEAIKILTEDTQHPTAGFMPELKEAEKLGIEALKQIKKDRFMAHPYCLNPLPGETKD